MQANPVDVGDFRRIELEFDCAGSPDDDRGDHETRPTRVVVQQSNNAVSTEIDPQFLAEFSQRGVLGCFPGVDSPPGKRPLAGMTVHSGRSTTE